MGRERGQERSRGRTRSGGEQMLGIGDPDHERERRPLADDGRADLGQRPSTHAVDDEAVVDDLEGELGWPRLATPLMVAHRSGQATEPTGGGHEPRVVNTPGLDPHPRSLPGVGPDRLPRSIVPMKAASGDLPTGPDWTFEVKWDGMRALAFVEGATLRLQSVNERDVTVSWPELDGLADALPAEVAVLDGELIATDDLGRPSFGLLQQRMHITNPAEAVRRAVEQPIVYVVFDLLHLDGNDLMALPLRDRRRLLDRVLEPAAAWQLSPLHDDGAALLAAAREQGLEGVVAKRLDSRYEPGKRSAAWRKVKVRRRQEMVIGGWLPGEGSRAGQIGALLVGYHDSAGSGGPLHFAGRVGTGFTDAELARLPELLGPLTTQRCPFDPPPSRGDLARGVTWVRPELVVELAFAEWTADDRLRHPSYLGLRADKAAVDVTRDE